MEWRRHVRRKEAQSTMTRTAPPRGDIQPVVAEWWMLTYEPASEPTSQPTNQPASQATNEFWSLGDRSAAIRRQGRRLPSELWRPWGDLGGFDSEDTRCVGRKNQTQRSTGRCTRDGRVCAPRGKGRRKRENEKRNKGGTWRKGGWKKAERKGRDGQREMAHTVAATTSYTNATSY